MGITSEFIESIIKSLHTEVPGTSVNVITNVGTISQGTAPLTLSLKLLYPGIKNYDRIKWISNGSFISEMATMQTPDFGVTHEILRGLSHHKLWAEPNAPHTVMRKRIFVLKYLFKADLASLWIKNKEGTPDSSSYLMSVKLDNVFWSALVSKC